jgi:hypothetical protein
MACLPASRVVPDLLYYTGQYVLNSVANKYKIPFSEFPREYLIPDNSFIRLLFDENWPTDLTNYQFLFKIENDPLSIPSDIRRRIKVFPVDVSYYNLPSCQGSIGDTNIFDLQPDDLNMLDLLLQYRLDNTSVNIVTIIYDDLSTVLSRLIYIYLRFKITRDYSLLDNEEPIARDDSVLENFYESYLVDIVFIYISSLGHDDGKTHVSP